MIVINENFHLYMDHDYLYTIHIIMGIFQLCLKLLFYITNYCVLNILQWVPKEKLFVNIMNTLANFIISINRKVPT